MATSEKDMGTEGCDDPELAKQIIKILNHVSESFEDVELTHFLNLVERLEKGKLNPEKVKELISKCTEMTLFKEGMTVHLTKQTVRSLIEINQDYKLWSAIWKAISRLAGPLNFSIMADFGQMDDATLEQYIALLQQGKESVRHIRLMVVGMFGVGKTTIIRRLCKQDVTNVKSTVGIDVSVNACEVNDENEWIIRDMKAKPEKYFKQRMFYAYHDQYANTDKDTRAETTKKVRLQKEKESSSPSVPVNVNVNVIERGENEPEPPNYPKQEDVPRVTPMANIQAMMHNFRENPEPQTQQFLDNVAKVFDEEIPEKRVTTVSIWDFAGQSIYYSTHHFFLSARAIYLLVLDISRELSDVVPDGELSSVEWKSVISMPKGFTCLDAFKFWMNSIYTYIAARKSLTNYEPTIVLVGTHKDKVKQKNPKKSEQNGWLENYKEEYFNKALCHVENTEIRKLVHRKKFFVSKDDGEDIFDMLKSDLTAIAEGQPFWDEKVPLSWIPLERSIESKKYRKVATDDGDQDEKCTMMELSELKEIDEKTEYPLKDYKQIKVFLNFQHALGNVLYYDTNNLEENIILDPQWILDAFKLFITHLTNTPPTQVNEWENFERYAILSIPLIDELINQSPNASFQKYKDKIVYYMEYLDVIAKPVIFYKVPKEESSCRDEEEDGKNLQALEEESSSDDEDDEEDQKVSKWPLSKQQEFYYVPCLLSQNPEKQDLKTPPDETTSTPVLCLFFKNGFLPAFVCHRLIATCIRKWEVTARKGKRMLFKGFGRFDLTKGKNNKLDIWWKDHVIYLRIICYSRGQKRVKRSLCTRVRLEVQRMIREIFSIHKNFSRNVTETNKVEYEEYIKCPKCHKDDLSYLESDADRNILPSLFKVDNFKDVAEITCDFEQHTIRRDEALSSWFNKENYKYKIDDLTKCTEEVLSYLKGFPAESIITEKQCADLSKFIATEYIALGLQLGLTFKRIQQLEMGEERVLTRIKNVLLEWKRCCEEPTLSKFECAYKKITGFYFKNKEERVKGIVKWYEKIENPNDSPCERELTDVIYLVGNLYEKLAKNLFKENRYATIRQIEMQYTLDCDRTLIILLTWKMESENVTFTLLKDCLVKTFKIDWDEIKRGIAQEERTARRTDEDRFLSPRQLKRETGNRVDGNREREMVEGTEDNGEPDLKEEFHESRHVQGRTSGEETMSTDSSEGNNE